MPETFSAADKMAGLDALASPMEGKPHLQASYWRAIVQAQLQQEESRRTEGERRPLTPYSLKDDETLLIANFTTVRDLFETTRFCGIPGPKGFLCTQPHDHLDQEIPHSAYIMGVVVADVWP